MSIADAILAEMLPPCPLCSFRKANHPELLSDILHIPSATQGRAGKRWFLLSGCEHSQRLPGNALGYDTKDDAEQAWREFAAGASNR